MSNKSNQQHLDTRSIHAGEPRPRLCGGLLSFEPKGDANVAEDFISRLQLPASAPSLGGVESLITRPAASSHAGMTPQQREAVGIRDELIRVAVGIEYIDDLLSDFDQAMAGITA